MPTKRVRTGEIYECLCNGMQLEVIDRINTNTGKKTLPIFEIVKKGCKGDSWLNKYDVGQTFGITRFNFDQLKNREKFKRIA
jgi:hypothetical protein